MTRIARFAFALLGVISFNVQAGPPPSERPLLNCDAGPTKKVFGGTDWFVFGCSDGKTIVIYSAPESPASPFYFMFYPEGGRYQLYGEGTGRKEATKAALDELTALSPQQTHDLIAEANRARK